MPGSPVSSSKVRKYPVRQGLPNSLLKPAAPRGPSRMISNALATRGGSGRSASHGRGRFGMRRCETEKPVRPALGLPPRPTAPSSRISPPEPVAAPGHGEIAVGWLWVSTLIAYGIDSTCARQTPSASAKKRAPSEPSITAALSLYADSVYAGEVLWVWRIRSKSVDDCFSPSTVKLALNTLCRQCSELACAT